mmetsp:Transcript_116396/g.307590  ORF Transcript_116396/g.307590 Transcript_116396/m.307590 type:complete len:262 (-) Transcript_116396:262-1047(-)
MRARFERKNSSWLTEEEGRRRRRASLELRAAFVWPRAPGWQTAAQRKTKNTAPGEFDEGRSRTRPERTLLGQDGPVSADEVCLSAPSPALRQACAPSSGAAGTTPARRSCRDRSSSPCRTVLSWPSMRKTVLWSDARSLGSYSMVLLSGSVLPLSSSSSSSYASLLRGSSGCPSTLARAASPSSWSSSAGSSSSPDFLASAAAADRRAFSASYRSFILWKRNFASSVPPFLSGCIFLASLRYALSTSFSSAPGERPKKARC